MLNGLQSDYVLKRLRIVHVAGIMVMISILVLMFFLGMTTDINTVRQQIILTLMAIVLSISYVWLAFCKSSEVSDIPKFPLGTLFSLNIFISILVWSTGTIKSPFIVMYAVVILVTAQLYKYVYAVIQTFLAFFGIVFFHTATVYYLLPELTIFPNVGTIIYDHTLVILLYGFLYASLLLFVLFSTSTSRLILFRPKEKTDIESTYQESIIAGLPVGIIIVDNDLNILTMNPAAEIEFPTHISSKKLNTYLSLPKRSPLKALQSLAKSKEFHRFNWIMNNGEERPLTLSVLFHKGNKSTDDSYILFLS